MEYVELRGVGWSRVKWGEVEWIGEKWSGEEWCRVGRVEWSKVERLEWNGVELWSVFLNGNGAELRGVE